MVVNFWKCLSAQTTVVRGEISWQTYLYRLLLTFNCVFFYALFIDLKSKRARILNKTSNYIMRKLERDPEVPNIYRRLNRPKQGRRTVVKQKLKPISSNYFKRSWLFEVMILQFAKARTTGGATTSLIVQRSKGSWSTPKPDDLCVCVCHYFFIY